jgi:hypothetical protein
LDDFTTLWHRLQLRTGSGIGPDLAQDYIRDSFNQLAERREWSWLMKSGAFFPPVYSVPGTVSVLPNQVTVTGSGTSFDATLVGKQFRVGSAVTSSYPTYTISQVPSTTTLILSQPWVGPTLTGQTYSLFQCYFPVPDDFQYFYSIVNTTAAYRLWHNGTQAQLDIDDPQRIQVGISYKVAFYDYTNNYIGTVNPILQVRGTGAVPVATTTVGYQFPSDSIYSVEITTGGASGTAVFKWKQDSGTYTSGVTTSATPLDLSNGVQVYFPTGTYVSGDVFIIQAVSQTTSGVPRYELWPRPINAQYCYPFLYACKLPDLTDERPQLPDFIARRGDVLLEMSLGKAALFPGTETMRNPYYSLQTAQMHFGKAETLIYELEKKDDETATKDLSFYTLPWAYGPYFDGAWNQSHAIYAGR